MKTESNARTWQVSERDLIQGINSLEKTSWLEGKATPLLIGTFCKHFFIDWLDIDAHLNCTKSPYKIC